MNMTCRHPRRTVQILFAVGLVAGILVQPILCQAQGNRDLSRVSSTAEWAAAMRAFAAMEPDESIRNPDNLAIKLVSEAFWQRRPYGRDFKRFKGVVKKYRIGSYYWVNARTKHIDGLLAQALARGVKQVVILGAGYDSRPYRFTAVPRDVRFFEVDLPATQQEKKARVQKALGSIPRRVVYVPIDFNTQTLQEALTKAGYDPAAKTFFIWEGVTMYLNGQGVDSTLDFIARNSAPGSSVVFDYLLQSIVDGTSDDLACQSGAKRVAALGEPWIYGIEQGTAGEFCAKRGLLLLSDLGPDQLETLYLIGKDGRINGPMAGCVRIMHAGVPVKKAATACGTEKRPD